MPAVSIKDLLEAGVHFGHQTKRWNPKMKPYIFGQRNGIYIIDLQKTLRKFREATDFLGKIAAEGRNILFVGTKRQAQEAISEEAQRCEMHFVNLRWLGGLLTNFQTIRKSLDRLRELDGLETDGKFEDLTKKERIRLDKQRIRLNRVLSGIRKMDRLPDALFVVDSHKEKIAVREARKLNIPVVAIVDTNCDPDEVDYVIPGNDDAIRAIRLFSSRIADSILEGSSLYQRNQQAEAEGEEKNPPVPSASVPSGKVAAPGGKPPRPHTAESRQKKRPVAAPAKTVAGKSTRGNSGGTAPDAKSAKTAAAGSPVAAAKKGSAVAE